MIPRAAVLALAVGLVLSACCAPGPDFYTPSQDQSLSCRTSRALFGAYGRGVDPLVGTVTTRGPDGRRQTYDIRRTR